MLSSIFFISWQCMSIESVPCEKQKIGHGLTRTDPTNSAFLPPPPRGRFSTCPCRLSPPLPPPGNSKATSPAQTLHRRQPGTTPTAPPPPPPNRAPRGPIPRRFAWFPRGAPFCWGSRVVASPPATRVVLLISLEVDAAVWLPAPDWDLRGLGSGCLDSF
jgi:hypothetical protein